MRISGIQRNSLPVPRRGTGSSQNAVLHEALVLMKAGVLWCEQLGTTLLNSASASAVQGNCREVFTNQLRLLCLLELIRQPLCSLRDAPWT